MRHRKASLKLGRTSSHRDAMFRNMVTSLFKYERIRTTDAKAKELSRWADHLITLAKKGDLHSRRQALSIMREKKVVHKLFEEASERFGESKGGHTRIVKIGYRPGDAARVSLVELTSQAKVEEKKPKKKKPESVKKDSKVEKVEKPTPDQEPESASKAKGAPEVKKAKKAVDTKKKKAAKKKSAPKESKADTKEKKPSSTKVKKEKSEAPKKTARPKKKAAAPKKSKEKKEK